MRIVVIEPGDPGHPCIRCETTLKRVQSAAECSSGEAISVVRMAASAEEAQQYGRVESVHGMETIGNVEPDSESVSRIWRELNALEVDEHTNAGRIDSLLKELDVAILPIRRLSEELGYLMTPVVVVNEKVKSSGYTPAEDEIRRWIEAELGG